MRQCIPPHFDHACEFRCRNAFGMVFFRGAATCSVGICIVDVVSALRCLRAEVFTNCVGSAFFSSRPFVHSPCLPAFVETCLVPLPLLLQRFRILASLREAHAKARYRRGSVNVAFTIIPDDLLEDVFKNKACDGHGGGRGLESLQDAGWDAPETPSDARVWAISGAPPDMYCDGGPSAGHLEATPLKERGSFGASSRLAPNFGLLSILWLPEIGVGHEFGGVASGQVPPPRNQFHRQDPSRKIEPGHRSKPRAPILGQALNRVSSFHLPSERKVAICTERSLLKDVRPRDTKPAATDAPPIDARTLVGNNRSGEVAVNSLEQHSTVRAPKGSPIDALHTVRALL